MTLTIVKLGGSAAFAPALRDWLAMLSACGSVCVVPGGGPFSECVRQAQPVMGFDDEAAHRMAILGMEQYAHALHSLCPALRAVLSKRDIADSASHDKPSLWFPAHMTLRDRTLHHSWSVTSDTLAVWLAGLCGARRVVLVKQGDHGGEADVAALCRRGYVDDALPAMLAAWQGELLIAGPHDHDNVRRAIQQGQQRALLHVQPQRGAA